VRGLIGLLTPVCPCSCHCWPNLAVLASPCNVDRPQIASGEDCPKTPISKNPRPAETRPKGLFCGVFGQSGESLVFRRVAGQPTAPGNPTPGLGYRSQRGLRRQRVSGVSGSPGSAGLRGQRVSGASGVSGLRAASCFVRLSAGPAASTLPPRANCSMEWAVQEKDCRSNRQ